MRDLQRQYRITGRSIPEVIGPMERALSFYGESRDVTFRGRKLSNEAFVNAAIIHLLALPAPAQRLALKAALTQLEAILEGRPEPLANPPGHEGQPQITVDAQDRLEGARKPKGSPRQPKRGGQAG